MSKVNKLETSIIKNKKNQPKGSKKFKGGLIIFIAFVSILLFGTFGSVLAYEYRYKDKIYPGVKIGTLNVGGRTTDSILAELTAFKDSIDKKGLIFIAENQEVVVSPILISPSDPDLNYRILSFDFETLVDQAYQVGRNGSQMDNFIGQFSALVYGSDIANNYDLNQTELITILRDNFFVMEKPAQNANFKINEEDQIEIIKEEAGQVLNYSKAVEELKENIGNFENKKVILELIYDQPEVKSGQIAPKLKQVEEVLATTTPALVYKKRKWQLEKSQLAQWLEFNKVGDEIKLQFNHASTTEYLDEVAESINQDPKDAKFKLEDSRVVEFQTNQDGLELDINKAYISLNNYFLDISKKEVELSVKVVPARVAIGDINTFGIKELIGEGTSDFSGSPKNRRHNISVGANSLNGLLIEPGEEFSLLKALGKIDAEHNYLPELVIKGNRTIPEYGGGLCQIGTTSFRVALDAGLEISRRRNHSYRVRYYEPAGMDATIYNPNPDFRFVNDTGYHILFTTIISGDELIFRFYGTSDGRKVEMTKPRVFNVTAPGPTKLIETIDLEPGVKKCTEHAVYGADAQFERTITYPDGEKNEEVWKSHYVPWTEVCLIGVEKLSESESEPECAEVDVECLKKKAEEEKAEEEDKEE